MVDGAGGSVLSEGEIGKVVVVVVVVIVLVEARTLEREVVMAVVVVLFKVER